MNLNDIKKALYKEKPIAKIRVNNEDSCIYTTRLADGTVLGFDIPFSEMSKKRFEEQIPAQLLIRWIDEKTIS